ncbi:TPA: hypothetical protein JG832_002509 [Enterobacter hormaechei subsp. xiangfangensis]|nr:hypothetical protein [Enterobacter hormaechei subsp. xiangfangensis]HAV1890644.1 hypothetical protein [Enterobacter hormaechei subsp. xiangfangensis]
MFRVLMAGLVLGFITRRVVAGYQKRDPMLPLWTWLIGVFIGLASATVASHYDMLWKW